MDNKNEDLFIRKKTLYKSILKGIAIPFFVIDNDFKIVFCNSYLEKLTGFKEEEVLGRYCHEVFRTNICSEHCAIKDTKERGRDVVNLETTILNKKGAAVPVILNTSLVRSKSGRVVGGMECYRDISFLKKLRKEMREKHTYHKILSKNKKILEIIQDLPDIAASDATVLIQGESGTGKELFANALHELSYRKQKPFIKVNCGALPETLLESELFGYKRGAFTDAKRDKPGRFTLAEEGTLFLDEIGEISKNVQVKLLRVLEQKEFEPLGSVETEKADVRIVAATNRDLHARVKAGDFREDLFYRLNVITISIPSLRERKEDIPLLIEHFLDLFNQPLDGKINGFIPSAMEILLNHDYPGNVRELENVIEHAFILCRENYISPKNLPDYLTNKLPPSVAGGNKIELLDNFEKSLIEETLKRQGGNLQATARKLGVHRSTLWRKIKRHHIAVTKV